MARLVRRRAGGQPVQRPEERGERLAGAGGGDDQRVLARLRGRPRALLRGGGRGEGAAEPVPGGGGEAVECAHGAIMRRGYDSFGPAAGRLGDRDADADAGVPRGEPRSTMASCRAAGLGSDSTACRAASATSRGRCACAEALGSRPCRDEDESAHTFREGTLGNMSERDVVVLSAVRSAIGSFGGGLSDIEPADLAGTVIKEAVTRSAVDPATIDDVTVGNCIPTESRYPYVARVAAIQGGLSMDSVAMAVNRLCSSGLQAVVTTAQNIKLGDADFGVGGGVEVMSRAPTCRRPCAAAPGWATPR